MPRVTIMDVAREAGVSKGAASLALNGKPGVAEATRARVVRIADELGWRPHFTARALASSSVGAYGLIIARPTRSLADEHFFMSLIAGIEQGLSERGLALVLQVVGDVREEVPLIEQWAAERRVDGVILIDPRVQDPRIAAVEHLDLPAVAFATGPLSPAIPTLVDDEEARTHLALDHLRAGGHERVVYLAGDPAFRHVQVREHHLTAHAASTRTALDTIHTDYTERAVEQFLSDLRARDAATRPTAVIADNDLLAVHLLGTATDAGLRIPRDLALLALEDSTLCRLITPHVTALARDIVDYGSRLVHLLTHTIRGGATHIEAPASALHIRASTSAAATGSSAVAVE